VQKQKDVVRMTAVVEKIALIAMKTVFATTPKAT